jgi:AcrR family transcriptional regulator
VNAKTGDLTAKQERSRETRRKLVASCLELVDRRPFDQVTVADIAKGAGVSVGNFYRRFKSKEGILPDLYAAYEERFAAFGKAFSEGEPIEPDDIRGRWDFLIGRTLAFMEDNRGLIQALHLHGRLHPEIVPPTSHDRRRSLFARVSELFSSADEARAQTMGQVAILVLVSTLTEQIIYPDHTPAVASDVSTAELADELGRMLAAYAAAPLG